MMDEAVWALVIPLVGALAILCLSSRPNLREAVTLLSSSGLLVVVGMIARDILGGQVHDVTLLQFAPGVSLAFKVEPFGVMFALLASSLWLINSIYSIGYVRRNALPRQTSFYLWFAVSLSATIGIAFAGNLFTLFLFYEALTLSTYPLVVHGQINSDKVAGRVYLGMLLGTSISLFLLGILWTWTIAGTLDFQLGGILKEKIDPNIIGTLLALFAFGIGKSALMPVHRWLPAAMVAPAPVSALLHAVAVVKAGVFSLVKILVYIFGIDLLAQSDGDNWLIYAAAFSMIAAAIIALRQDDLKRRLAYSTISQLAYIVLAAAVAHPVALIGAMFQVIGHALGKIILFFAAGSIYTVSGRTKVSQLDGIGRRMPWTMAAFTIGAMCIVGLPGTIGFWGKWYMFQGGALSAQQLFIIGVLLTSTLVSAAYLVPIVYAAFFKSELSSAPSHGEAPWPMVVPIIVTAAAVMMLFFAVEWPYQLISLLKP